MPNPTPKFDGDRCYGVVVSNHATSASGTPWRWSPPFERPGEAAEWARAALRAGDATLGFVVGVKGGRRRVLLGSTQPGSAERVIKHYLELLDLIEE